MCHMNLQEFSARIVFVIYTIISPNVEYVAIPFELVFSAISFFKKIAKKNRVK